MSARVDDLAVRNGLQTDQRMNTLFPVSERLPYSVPELVLLGDLRSMTLDISGLSGESSGGTQRGFLDRGSEFMDPSPPVEGIGNPFDLR